MASARIARLVAFASVLSSGAAWAQVPAEAPAPQPAPAPENPAPAIQPAPAPAPAPPPLAPPPAVPPPPPLWVERAYPYSGNQPPPIRARALPAEQPAPEQAAPVDDGQRGSYQDHFYAQLAVRSSRIQSDNYQWFSETHALNAVTFSFGRALTVHESWTAALSANWDYGSASADARGSATKLELHRLTLAPELRFHFIRRLYGYGRVGAGVASLATQLSDAVVQADRTQQTWLFTFDASLGAAFQVFGQRPGNSRAPRGWLFVEGGYLFTGSSRQVLENSSSNPVRTDPIDLGKLALGGPTLRAGAALTF